MRTLRITLGAFLFLVPAAFSATITYTADLSGAGESTSPGTGFAEVVLDTTANTLLVDVSFSGLTSPDTASHIHCCTATPLTGTAPVATAVPTFPGFPLGVMSGTYDQTFDLGASSTYNPSFVTSHGGTVAGAESALIDALAGGQTYLNIHTRAFPSGEIDGFLVPTPEPATFSLAASMLLGLSFLRRRSSARE